MKYLIIGAGPAGLAFANSLLDMGEKDFYILEAEGEAGGLCRSANVDGTPFDTGGGHFIDVRRPKVNEFLFRFMGQDEFNSFDRVTKIRTAGTRIDYPYEANIWQLPIDEEVEHLKSIAAAGCNTGAPEPHNFRDWIVWKLGEKIAEDYMFPYNEKIFSVDLDTLGTYWMNKLPDVSFEDTLRSCLMKQPYGSLPGHARFYYPARYGSGELWLRMAERISDKTEYNVRVSSIDLEAGSVNGGDHKADIIINTAPWTCFKEIRGASDEFREAVQSLKYSSIVVKYLPEVEDDTVNWEYVPSREVDYHRILYRNTFATGSKGSWAEINKKRYKPAKGDTAFISEYAYPLNTVDKPEKINLILKEAASHGVYGLGRWGEWEHYNSDLVVELAMKLAERLEK
ncbi:MAG: FAD-dependent oxidoreductase [Lachnospiraceae bacterium]|nr:FAD-dependent oxidoreductase [Lachnospiraceae bacterium]